ncbi:MAG: hypothetical protein KTR31_02040 [Myxococcales bacterium]|nr:hypothetical protein [Myxococcales bacterium]
MSHTLTQAVHEALVAALEAGPSVMFVSETAGRPGDPTAEWAERFSDRIVAVPVADRGVVGMAIGMAMGGKRPVVSLSGTASLPRIVGPLAHAGTLAQRGEFDVPLVVRLPYGTQAPGIDQPVGRFVGDLPGVAVVCPSSPRMAAGLLRTALRSRGPTVILEPRSLQRTRGPVGTEPEAPTARVLREGRHVTLAAWGAGVQAAQLAADALDREGVQADVLDLVSLAPLDVATLGARVRRTGRLVVVHPQDDSLARHVRQASLEEAFLYLEAPLGQATASQEQVASAARSAVSY